MKKALGIIVVLLMVMACEKDKTSVSVPTPTLTKWELIPGHYKVFDTLWNKIYEMDILYSNSFSINNVRVDTLHFINFDGQFNLTVKQEDYWNYPDMITTGSFEAIKDSINNRWDLFCYSPDSVNNNFRKDTIVFYFEKQNMPYWWNDGTSFFQGFVKQIAVKQH